MFFYVEGQFSFPTVTALFSITPVAGMRFLRCACCRLGGRDLARRVRLSRCRLGFAFLSSKNGVDLVDKLDELVSWSIGVLLDIVFWPHRGARGWIDGLALGTRPSHRV